MKVLRSWGLLTVLFATQAVAEEYGKQLVSIYREFRTAQRRLGGFGSPLRYGQIRDAGENERAALAAKAKLDKLPFGKLTPDEQLDYMLVANGIEGALLAHRSAVGATAELARLPFELPVREIARSVSDRRFLLLCADIAAAAPPPVPADYMSAKRILDRMQEARDVISRAVTRLSSEEGANKRAVRAAGDRARAALEAWRKELGERSKSLPGAEAPYAVGEAKFRHMIRYNDMLDLSPDELIALGFEYLAKTKQEMKDLAREIEPDKSLDEVWQAILDDRPQTGKEIVPLAEQNIQEAIALIQKEGFVTIPEFVSLCKVVEVGERNSGIYPYGAYNGVGIRGGKYLGNYVVNPGYAWMSADTLVKHLQGNNRIWTRVVTLHETYPGHHLQGAYAAAVKNTIRQGAYSNTCVEGWGLYCEDLMFRHGYYPDQRYRLAQLRMRLWRCARVILDCSLHCKGMKQADAVDFLVREVGLERVNAESEVRRYVTAPTQPLSYLNGWLGLTDLYESYRAKMGSAFVERDFHDRLLSLGSLPIKLLKWRMLQSPPPTASYAP